MSARNEFEVAMRERQRSVARTTVGQYLMLEVELAWAAWQIASEHERAACIEVCTRIATTDWPDAAAHCATAIRNRNHSDIMGRCGQCGDTVHPCYCSLLPLSKEAETP